MNELTKTLTYLGVAIVLAVAAWASRPRLPEFEIQDKVGQPLFADFQDPTDAARLVIDRFDEALGELHSFEVAKEPGTGRWIIPSHSNYPADAENQMRDAATALIDLKVLDIASEQEEDHKVYGVIEPDAEKLKVGDEGVGLDISIENAKGKNLASLIIGGKVKGKDDQRFVRVAGQAPVYVVKVDPEKLSTKFDDWIEKDLLKLNAWDIQQIKIKDYSVVQTNRGPVLDRRFDVSLTYNNDDYKWKLDEMVNYQDNKGTTTKLAEDEELNTDRVNDLKNALDEIKIVDVRRKPKGLGADLKAEQSFLKNEESLDSLVERGFYIDPNGLDLWAANGDMQVAMKDGVGYILRFGNIAGAETTEEESKLNRYLFVTARLDESRIPKPELEPLPEVQSKDEDAAPAPAEKEAAGGEAAKSAPAKEESGKQEKANDSGADAKKDAKDDGAGGNGGESAEENAGDEKQKASAKQGEEEKDDSAGDQKAAEEKKGEETADTAEDEKDTKSEQEKERERVEKENKRKQDEYDEKVKEAKKKVQELNDRFSEWYYVISEDVYKKIHLGRGDLIKESEKAKEEGEGVDAFRELEKGGLEGGKEDKKDNGDDK